MSAALSSRSAKRAPQLALRLGAMPDGAIDWCDGVGITYFGRELHVRLGTVHNTEHTVAALVGENLHLPLPPEASARQIQDSAEAWLRQQCLAYVDEVFAQLQNRQLEVTGSVGLVQPTRSAGTKQCFAKPLLRRRQITVQLSFAARATWIAVEDANTLRCNWRLIEQTPQVILQHAEKALREIDALQNANATTDMFSATFN